VRPVPWGPIPMVQPRVSRKGPSRPMPRCLDAAGAAAALPSGFELGCAISRGGGAPQSAAAKASALPAASALRDFNILHLAAFVHLPRLDAVIVVDGVDPAIFAQLVLAWLHVTRFIHGAGLQQQLAAIPVELVIEARERPVPNGAIDLCRTPVAAAVERDVDARDLAAAGPGDT